MFVGILVEAKAAWEAMAATKAVLQLFVECIYARFSSLFSSSCFILYRFLFKLTVIGMSGEYVSLQIIKLIVKRERKKYRKIMVDGDHRE